MKHAIIAILLAASAAGQTAANQLSPAYAKVAHRALLAMRDAAIIRTGTVVAQKTNADIEFYIANVEAVSRKADAEVEIATAADRKFHDEVITEDRGLMPSAKPFYERAVVRDGVLYPTHTLIPMSELLKPCVADLVRLLKSGAYDGLPTSCREH